jgi:hypothetical protein
VGTQEDVNAFLGAHSLAVAALIAQKSGGEKQTRRR